MLILSRKKDEKIVINDDIQIQIVDIRNDTVKIGINAPKHIEIYREEVWDTIQEENVQANIDVNSEKHLDSISKIQRRFAKQSLNQYSDNFSNRQKNNNTQEETEE